MLKRVTLLFFVSFEHCISYHCNFEFAWLFQDLDSKLCLNVEFPYYDKSNQVFQDLFSYIGAMVHLKELLLYRNAQACSLAEDLIKNRGPSVFCCKTHVNFTEVFKWCQEEIQDYCELLDVINMAWVEVQKRNDILKRDTRYDYPLKIDRTELR